MRTVLLLLMTVLISVSQGQSVDISSSGEQQQQIPLIFNQQEFGDRFSVLSFSDDNYDYYVVDLTKIGDRFERIYFMNLTYGDSRLVNLDADIEKEQTWFKTYYTNKEGDIDCLFKDLKEQTGKMFNEMTADEKAAWMSKNDKFKKADKNE